LNTEGYRKMGDTIYEEGLCPVLREIIKRDVSSGSA